MRKGSIGRELDDLRAERDRLQEEVERLRNDHQHNAEGCDCRDSAKCNCWCHWKSRAERAEKMARELAEALRKICGQTEHGFEKASFSVIPCIAEQALAAYTFLEGGK